MTNSQQHFDCIVLGFGGVGSQALRFAAEKGWRVLGVDRYGPAHDKGSSHGQTRIIRRAYFEHPNYVPLAHRAFEMWDELNRRHRTSVEIKELMTSIGLLQVGRPDSDVIQGVAESASRHGLRVEEFRAKEIEGRLPIFQIPADHIGLFEADAAFLRVELCVAAAVKQAVRAGAQLVSNTTVLNWRRADSGTIEVVTADGAFFSDRLLICGGAWSPELLPGVEIDLKILQKQQHWFQIDRVEQKIENNFPAFLFEQDDGSCFYGIPEIDYLGLKVCEHSGGTELKHAGEIDRDLNQDELERTLAFMNEHLRHSYARMVHHSACMYSMSPDGHFFVDRHPRFENVAFAAGLSGHGFKFAPVIGKRLVGLLCDETDVEMDFLKLSRAR